MMKSFQRLLQYSVLIIFGCVLAFTSAEIVVRLFFPERILPRFVVDTGFGVRGNQPDVVTRHYVPEDYDVVVSTNSAGMRGTREYSVNKPNNVYRIAVIGDSFIFGHGVNNNEVISVVLEDKLNNRADKKHQYEVLNYSVSGFGQAEQLITYQNLIKQYKPDLAVLFYFSNDIGNNSVSELYELNENGQIERTENSFLPGVKLREKLYGFAPTRWLFTNSQFWNLIRNRLSLIVQKSLLEKQGLKSFDDTKKESVLLTRALLMSFTKELKQDSVDVILFLIPDKDKEKNSLETNFPFMDDAELLSELVCIDGSTYLDPSDYYINDSHWRPSGHAKAAELIVKELLKE